MARRAAARSVWQLPSRVQFLAPAARQGGLAYLDQVPVGITQVAADLGLVLFRWREELGASRAPLRIDRVDVRDPDVEEAADQVWIARCLECDGRLVLGRTATHVDDDPAVGERHVCRLTRAGDLATEHLGIEATGALHVVRNDEVGQRDLKCGLAAFGHPVPPRSGLRYEFPAARRLTGCTARAMGGQSVHGTH